MAVLARTDDAEPRAGSFLVRNDAPGISIERTWDHLGLRASRSDDVTFDATPALAAILDPPPDLSLMAWSSLGLSSLYLGVAAAARDWLISKDRSVAVRTATASQRTRWHYRDVLCARVHTPQDDSIAVAAGRAALGRWQTGDEHR